MRSGFSISLRQDGSRTARHRSSRSTTPSSMLATFDCAGLAARRAPRHDAMQLAQEFLARVASRPRACASPRSGSPGISAHLREVGNVVQRAARSCWPGAPAECSRRRWRGSGYGLVEILRGLVIQARAALDDGARQQLAGHGLGERTDLVDRVLGGWRVAVELRRAEVVEVALPVVVDADGQADAVVALQPLAAQLSQRGIGGGSRRVAAQPRRRPAGRSERYREKSGAGHSWRASSRVGCGKTTRPGDFAWTPRPRRSRPKSASIRWM